MAVVSDPARWIEAGGDPLRLEVLGRVGRAATFTDGDSRALAAIHPARPAVGTVGDWVGGHEVLQAAEHWLAEQGCASAEGPALLAPWFPHRANLGPYEQPPLAFEPTERPDRWLRAGWTEAQAYVSILSAHDPQIKAATDRAAALGSRGWRLESAASFSSTPDADPIDVLAPLIHGVASRACGPNFPFVPVSAVIDFYRPVFAGLDSRLTLVARDPEGLPVGFLLAVPETLQPKRKWFQILSLAVLPEHRNAGVATWMVGAAHRAAERAGYVAGVHALVRVDPGVQDRSWFRGEVVRRYALYARALA